MRYKLGRFLQLVGMLILPLAIARQVAFDATFSLGQMFLWTAVGMIVFYVGREVQGPAR